MKMGMNDIIHGFWSVKTSLLIFITFLVDLSFLPTLWFNNCFLVFYCYLCFCFAFVIVRLLWLIYYFNGKLKLNGILSFGHLLQFITWWHYCHYYNLFFSFLPSFSSYIIILLFRLLHFLISRPFMLGIWCMNVFCFIPFFLIFWCDNFIYIYIYIYIHK